MLVTLAHLLTILAVCMYSYASVGYARVLFRPRAQGWVPYSLLRSVLTLGVIAHLCFMLVSGVSALPLARFPLAVSLISLLLILAFLLIEKKYRVSVLGAFLAPLALFFLLIASAAFHGEMQQAPSQSSGVYLSFHLFSIALSYVMLFVAGATSLVLLIGERALKQKKINVIEFPSLVFLDRLHRSLLLWGFFILILGIVTGLHISYLSQLASPHIISRLIQVLPELVVYVWLLATSFFFGMRGRRLALFTLSGGLIIICSLVAMYGSSVGVFHVR